MRNNEKYTQLAKEGKFDELPDTCEFSEPVELEVWDNELMTPVITYVLGKFKCRYVTEANLCWQYAKLPTKEIDFLEFKAGDVVEVNYEGVCYVAYFNSADNEHNTIHLSFDNEQTTTEGYSFNKIKSITKIK